MGTVQKWALKQQTHLSKMDFKLCLLLLIAIGMAATEQRSTLAPRMRDHYFKSARSMDFNNGPTLAPKQSDHYFKSARSMDFNNDSPRHCPPWTPTKDPLPTT